MFKNKLLVMLLIIVGAILLLSVAAYFLYLTVFPQHDQEAVEGESKVQSIDEILPLIISIPKINTNLGDSSIIVIELTLQVDNEKAAEEAEKRIYQIQDRINLYLKNLTIDSFSTEDKILQFKAELITRLNTLLQEGKVVSIDITQLFLQ